MDIVQDVPWQLAYAPLDRAKHVGVIALITIAAVLAVLVLIAMWRYPIILAILTPLSFVVALGLWLANYIIYGDVVVEYTSTPLGRATFISLVTFAGLLNYSLARGFLGD